MPRSFTEDERKYIKQRLVEQAKICLEQYGVRRTTVDELVKRANIPKGTFYLFYSSKELVFFDVLSELHEQLHTHIIGHVQSMGESATARDVADLCMGVFQMVDQSLLHRLIEDGELELLMRKLPPEVAAAHAGEDDMSMEKLISLLPGVHIRPERIAVYSAAMRAVFLTTLHRHEVGDELFDDALRVMLEGVIMQMFEENEA
ncbi:MAG: TetR/AcrR family transcriptional regulator [Acetanaerobacterium sp.]